jgi:hypothetical protein
VRATTLRLVGLERLEIIPDGACLIATLRERSFVVLDIARFFGFVAIARPSYERNGNGAFSRDGGR